MQIRSYLVVEPGMQLSKTLIVSMNEDKKKSLETEFMISICRLNGNKRQSKTFFLAIFDPRLSIVKSVLIAAYPV